MTDTITPLMSASELHGPRPAKPIHCIATSSSLALVHISRLSVPAPFSVHIAIYSWVLSRPLVSAQLYASSTHIYPLLHCILTLASVPVPALMVSFCPAAAFLLRNEPPIPLVSLSNSLVPVLLMHTHAQGHCR